MSGEAFWHPVPAAGGSLDDLTDVDVSTTPPLNAQALVWDDASQLWVPGTVSGGGASAELIHVRDEKSAGTAGGTLSGGSWQTRTLNTTKVNQVTGASLSSNQLTLPAGAYEFRATAPAWRVGRHRVRLYDVTNSTELALGSLDSSGSADASGSTAYIQGYFTLAGTAAVEVQHRSPNTKTSDGLGLAADDGSIEVFADLMVWKVG